MAKALALIAIYRQDGMEGVTRIVKDGAPWLQYITEAERPIINLERVQTLEELRHQNPVLDYVERTLRLLQTWPESFWLMELAEEALIWSEAAKGGTEQRRRLWAQEGINLFAHNVGSAELYRRHMKESGEEELSIRSRIVHLLIQTHGLIGQQIRGEVPPEVNLPLAEPVEEGLLTSTELERLLRVLNGCIIGAVSPALWQAVQPETEAIIAAVVHGAKAVKPLPMKERLRRMRSGPIGRGENFDAGWEAAVQAGFRPERLEALRHATFWYVEAALQTFSLEQFLKLLTLAADGAEPERVSHISFEEAMNGIYYDYKGSKKVNVYKKRIIEHHLAALAWKDLNGNADLDTARGGGTSGDGGNSTGVQADERRVSAASAGQRLLNGANEGQDEVRADEILDQTSRAKDGQHPISPVIADPSAAIPAASAAPASPHLRTALHEDPLAPGTVFFRFVFSPAAEKLIEFCQEAEKSPLYDRAVLLLFDLFGLRRDGFDRFHNEDEYLSQMNETADYKAVIVDYVTGRRVLDIGPGGGVLLDMLEERLPEAVPVGIELSASAVEALLHRKQREGRRWEIVQGDALRLSEYVEAGSVDTVVFSSILHELYSYVPFEGRAFNHDTVAAALRSAFGVLAPGGRIIIRDGIMTEPESAVRTIRFMEADGMAWLERYARDFAGRDIRFDRLGPAEARLPVNDAMEFLYTYTWGEEAYVHEVQEQFGYFTPSAYRAFIQETLGEGASIEVFRHYLQEGYTEALSGRVELVDEEGRETALPDSTCFIVIEKRG